MHLKRKAFEKKNDKTINKYNKQMQQTNTQIKEYTFKEIPIGLKQAFTKTITQKDMQLFLELSCDLNPLHNDENYAKQKNFSGRVVFGMLVASTLSKLAGMHLPGKNSLIVSTQINFLNPAFVGDTITIEGEVVEKKEFANLIKVNYTINRDKDKLSAGNMLIKVLE